MSDQIKKRKEKMFDLSKFMKELECNTPGIRINWSETSRECIFYTDSRLKGAGSLLYAGMRTHMYTNGLMQQY